ncbi:MAG: ANTAR domain-containing protein, partial [Actinobacteria bacterium]|nr:ANTAR domain-containing protein [Actinomycetota bacterium]
SRTPGAASSVQTRAKAAPRREEQLEQKAQTRSLIGQAMGIIMARSGVSADEAFEMLSAASQRTNEKLLHVAQRIVEQRPREQSAQ